MEHRGLDEAASAVLVDYASLLPEQRNVLRLIFCHRLRPQMSDWEATARFTVACFRSEVTRTGTSQQAQALVEKLSSESPEFAAMWCRQDVQKHSEGTKRIPTEDGALITLEYSSSAVE